VGGKDFDDRRDTAVIRLFLDTGMRLAELAGLSLDDHDLDLDQGVAVVAGKGRRPRACPFGARTRQTRQDSRAMPLAITGMSTDRRSPSRAVGRSQRVQHWSALAPG
jgi:site-specific recombinase XerC